MRFLLDTHVFIWTLTDSSKLPVKTKTALQNLDNEFFVSAVSLWEMAIKIRSGRLEPIGRWSDPVGHAASLGFQTVPLLPEDAASSGSLQENTQFDPFDRMLIWQAISRNLTLVSGDKEFRRFEKDGLRLLWN